MLAREEWRVLEDRFSEAKKKKKESSKAQCVPAGEETMEAGKRVTAAKKAGGRASLRFKSPCRFFAWC
jgi:hypothetical protein